MKGRGKGEVQPDLGFELSKNDEASLESIHIAHPTLKIVRALNGMNLLRRKCEHLELAFERDPRSTLAVEARVCMRS